MEKQVVNKIISADSLKTVPHPIKNKFQTELLNHFKAITATAKELGIDADELWRVYINKCDYNQFDTRERRHIMFTSNEEKNQHAEQEKIKAQKDFNAIESQTIINGYDINTQQMRKMNRDMEYSLAMFKDKKDIEALSSMVPPYIKFKVLKCANLYLVDIPTQCVDKFPGLFILLVPKKQTVLIGIDTISPDIDIPNMDTHKVSRLRIAFIDSDRAEQIDDSYPNKFWFYENYNPKRKYHFIYSNSRVEK